MSELISGKEALIALANGEDVECRAYEKNWIDAGNYANNLGLFFDESFEFRIKPRTITINGIEVPAPFEPEIGDSVFYLNDTNEWGYCSDIHSAEYTYKLGVWRTEEEIKKVVKALGSIFK